MAVIAIRAAMLAKKRRADLVSKAASMTSIDLDRSEKRALLDQMRESPSTVYLSDLARSAESEYPPSNPACCIIILSL